MQAVLEELPDVILAYGHSDEFSFVLKKHSELYERRARCDTELVAAMLCSSVTQFWRSVAS